MWDIFNLVKQLLQKTKVHLPISMTVCYWHKLDMLKEITLVINSPLFLFKQKKHIVSVITTNTWIEIQRQGRLYISMNSKYSKKSWLLLIPISKIQNPTPSLRCLVFDLMRLSVANPIPLPLKNHFNLCLLGGEQSYIWPFGKKITFCFPLVDCNIIVLCTDHLTSLLLCF